MSQGVTYADLRFVRTPPEKGQEKGARHQGDQIRTPPSGPHPSDPPPDPSEGELTYENVQWPPCQKERTPTATEGTKEPHRRTWFTFLALLAGCLFLLATTIGLGVQYWQVSQQLQQAAEDGTALERRIGSQEGSLAQAQAQLEEAKGELHSTQGALGGCWAAGNRTQEQLRHQGEQLRQANQSLMVTQQQKEELEQEKEELEQEKARLQQEKEQQQEENTRLQQEKDAVQQQLEEIRRKLERDCCPYGWKLFGWKCLEISSSGERKSWWESKKACEKLSSQLLVLKPFSAEELWDATVIDKNYPYWIGLKKDYYSELWKWVDGTAFRGAENIGYCEGTATTKDCVQMSQGALQQCHCRDQKRFICEKKAHCPQPL